MLLLQLYVGLAHILKNHDLRSSTLLSNCCLVRKQCRQGIGKRTRSKKITTGGEYSEGANQRQTKKHPTAATACRPL
ncbi:unnamed protein product [Clavelina lepadiformis]|uniref:Secreted protein n=1 Tax=Clavelina lepadiformis TaxID=159417 RepID=A0ABP0GYV5_CLALP